MNYFASVLMIGAAGAGIGAGIYIAADAARAYYLTRKFERAERDAGKENMRMYMLFHWPSSFGPFSDRTAAKLVIKYFSEESETGQPDIHELEGSWDEHGIMR